MKLAFLLWVSENGIVSLGSLPWTFLISFVQKRVTVSALLSQTRLSSIVLLEQSNEVMCSFSCPVLAHDVTTGDELTAVWQSDHGKVKSSCSDKWLFTWLSKVPDSIPMQTVIPITYTGIKLWIKFCSLFIAPFDFADFHVVCTSCIKLFGLAESLRTLQTIWNQVCWLTCIESQCEELPQCRDTRMITWRSSPVWPEAAKRWFWAFVKFSGGGICAVSSIRAMASCLLALCPIIRCLARDWPYTYQPSVGELDTFPAHSSCTMGVVCRAFWLLLHMFLLLLIHTNCQTLFAIQGVIPTQHLFMNRWS